MKSSQNWAQAAWRQFTGHARVADWYSDNYFQQQVANDPQGPESGQNRVVRGGSRVIFWTDARAARRYFSNPADYTTDTGLRIVIIPPPTSTPTPTPSLTSTLPLQG